MAAAYKQTANALAAEARASAGSAPSRAWRPWLGCWLAQQTRRVRAPGGRGPDRLAGVRRRRGWPPSPVWSADMVAAAAVAPSERRCRVPPHDPSPTPLAEAAVDERTDVAEDAVRRPRRRRAPAARRSHRRDARRSAPSASTRCCRSSCATGSKRELGTKLSGHRGLELPDGRASSPRYVPPRLGRDDQPGRPLCRRRAATPRSAVGRAAPAAGRPRW